MKRTVLAIAAGLLVWILVISLLNRGLRLGLAGYAAAEPAMSFTLTMMAARLTIAALASLSAAPRSAGSRGERAQRRSCSVRSWWPYSCRYTCSCGAGFRRGTT